METKQKTRADGCGVLSVGFDPRPSVELAKKQPRPRRIPSTMKALLRLKKSTLARRVRKAERTKEELAALMWNEADKATAFRVERDTAERRCEDMDARLCEEQDTVTRLRNNHELEKRTLEASCNAWRHIAEEHTLTLLGRRHDDYVKKCIHDIKSLDIDGAGAQDFAEKLSQQTDDMIMNGGPVADGCFSAQSSSVRSEVEPGR